VQTISELGETNKVLTKTNATLGVFDQLIQKVTLLRR
jgi:hypothetical protein